MKTTDIFDQAPPEHETDAQRQIRIMRQRELQRLAASTQKSTHVAKAKPTPGLKQKLCLTLMALSVFGVLLALYMGVSGAWGIKMTAVGVAANSLQVFFFWWLGKD